MGWWWSSTQSSTNPPNSSSISSAHPQTTSSHGESIPQPTQPSSRNKRTQEEELAEFMPIFANQSPSQTTQTTPTTPSETSTSSPTTDPIAPYPTTMSCRQAFDNAFYCQSLGGQFNNVYRYGQLKDCKTHWSEFWFCMRTKSKSEETKAELIQEWYRKKEDDKYRTGPSSEDVWQERKVRVERAFDLDPDEVGE